MLMAALAAPLAGQAEPVYSSQVQSTEILRGGRNAAGDAIAYPCTDQPEVTGIKVKIPAGAETGWHHHTVPGYAYVLSGTLTLHYEGAPSRTFKAGEAFVESAGRRHNGKNLGTEDIVLVVFFTGEAGKPFTIKGQAAKESVKPEP
jgi:quercetin dioxygenase-like cupin family protein